jgi:nucleotide-binding universal stress UspA family protein
MKIVAATDGSRTSAAAVRFAAHIASASRGELNVLTVGELSPRVVLRPRAPLRSLEPPGLLGEPNPVQHDGFTGDQGFALQGA